MNLTFTLATIRSHSPCAPGWTTLLSSLNGISTPLNTIVSLGDVARRNGAADAWWCIRCLEDWSDVAVRRAVIGALLPCINRAVAHTTDQRVHDCVDAITRWQGGDDTVDLVEAARAAWAAEAAARAASRAAWAARAAQAAELAAWAAAEAAAWAAEWAAEARAEAARAAADDEREQQRIELIAAFPPLHTEPVP